jgi:hypothetical protein
LPQDRNATIYRVIGDHTILPYRGNQLIAADHPVLMPQEILEKLGDLRFQSRGRFSIGQIAGAGMKLPISEREMSWIVGFPGNRLFNPWVVKYFERAATC